MKKTVLCILFCAIFSSLYSQSKAVKNQAIIDSLRVFIKAFSADVQQLAYESDSLKISQLQNHILQKYFTDNEFIFPNILEEDDFYREKRPTISINKLLQLLPFAYWQGFQFVADAELTKVTSIKKVFGRLKEVECLIPFKVWGIKATTKKSNRVGEFLKVTIVPSEKKLAFRNVSFTEYWVFDEPLTTKVLQNIENEFVEEINTLKKFRNNTKKRRLICEKLQTKLHQDTIFFYESDKVLRAFSINDCANSKYNDDFWNRESEVLLKSFDLSYVTDIHLSENGQYIGLRSRIENVSLHSSEQSQWMKNRKNDFIIVSPDVAQSQISYWQLSNVLIQTLIKQK